MQGASAGATTTSDRPPPPTVHYHLVRAPLRSFVAGGGLVAIAMLASALVTWTMARDAAPQSGAPGFAPGSSSAATPPPQTWHVVLDTPIPTDTPTPTATTTPFPTDTPDPLLLCSTATPGAACRVPPPLAVTTPTQIPDCYRMAELTTNTLCTWIGTATATPTGTPVFGIDTEG